MEQGFVLLQKPFDLAGLEQALRELQVAGAQPQAPQQRALGIVRLMAAWPGAGFEPDLGSAIAFSSELGESAILRYEVSLRYAGRRV